MTEYKVQSIKLCHFATLHFVTLLLCHSRTHNYIDVCLANPVHRGAVARALPTERLKKQLVAVAVAGAVPVDALK